MRTQQQDIECAIKSDVNVLISGGDSVSRAALAWFIHKRSSQRQRPMMVVGSRLTTQPKGCTVFIEELAALDGRAQDELMRLLDSPGCQDAGEVPETRIISGTAYNLLRRTSWAFNADLFYRLNVIHIALGDARPQTSSTIH